MKKILAISVVVLLLLSLRVAFASTESQEIVANGGELKCNGVDCTSQSGDSLCYVVHYVNQNGDPDCYVIYYLPDQKANSEIDLEAISPEQYQTVYIMWK